MDIGVMKLDAQGFECRILDGMPHTLPRIERILFESDNRLLSAFQCSSQTLFDRLSQGRMVYSADMTKHIPSFDHGGDGADYIALLHTPKQTGGQVDSNTQIMS